MLVLDTTSHKSKLILKPVILSIYSYIYTISNALACIHACASDCVLQPCCPTSPLTVHALVYCVVRYISSSHGCMTRYMTVLCGSRGSRHTCDTRACHVRQFIHTWDQRTCVTCPLSYIIYPEIYGFIGKKIRDLRIVLEIIMHHIMCSIRFGSVRNMDMEEIVVFIPISKCILLRIKCV